MLENNQKENLLLKIGYKEPEFIMDLGMQYANSTSKLPRRVCLYKCFCGSEFTARPDLVKSKKRVGCGCTRKYYKNTITHGLSNHRLYDTWRNMVDRCTKSNVPNYSRYGERGIKVCDRWLNVENFIEDMYPSYKDGLTLDRIDIDGNYEKDNCRWATKTVQSRNTTKLYKRNTSGYRGVGYIKKNKNYRARIVINYKDVHLGVFNTALEAAKAYDKYIIENNLEHTRNFS